MKKSFPERLRELRGNKSQSEFSAEIGTKQTTYSSWERGIKEPDITTICAISTHFGVSADWLFGLSEDNSFLKSAAANFKNNSPEKAVESEEKTASEGSLKAPWKGADCATCKYRLFAEAFKALQKPD